MATFTVCAKIEYFCNAKAAGMGEIFVQEEYLAARYWNLCSKYTTWTNEMSSFQR